MYHNQQKCANFLTKQMATLQTHLSYGDRINTVNAQCDTKQAVLQMLVNQLHRRLLSYHSSVVDVQIGTQGVMSPGIYIVLHDKFIKLWHI